MIHYRLYFRMALSGLIVRDRDFKDKDDLYRYIGYQVCNTLEKIEDIRYEIIREEQTESRQWGRYGEQIKRG